MDKISASALMHQHHISYSPKYFTECHMSMSKSKTKYGGKSDYLVFQIIWLGELSINNAYLKIETYEQMSVTHEHI